MAGKSDLEFEKLLDHLKQSRGFDFTAYKRTTLQRRIQKRMQARSMGSYGEYQDYLGREADEFQILFNTILINVTSFFRDPEDWDFLAKQVIPKLVSARSDGGPIRIWSAGCASGEEAYSIAILLCEALGPDLFKECVKIYATDVDEEALTQSRSASYTEKEAADVPPPLLEKYFQKGSDGRLVFDRDIRRSVIFGRHDLIQDAPISRVDLVLCRNTLMYFQIDAQERVLSRFYFALNDGGFLFLGQAETITSHSTLFAPFDPKRRLLMKVPRTIRHLRGLAVPAAGDPAPPPPDGISRLRDAIIYNAPLAQFVVDAQGRLFLSNERARTLFGISTKDIGRPIQDLEISYRPIELRSRIEQAISTRRTVEEKEINWTVASSDAIVLDLRITPLYDEAARLLGVGVTWEDVSHFKRLQEELINFNQELETAYQELQSTNEELQTTNEELQSTVEELETTNEELQSTNEELETMNEELQSTNEELETINEELRQRSDELNEANAFLHAILAGFSEGVIVLDHELHVLAWNPKSQELWGMRSDEVLGKHLLNLDIHLPTEQISPLIKSVLTGQAEKRNVEIDTLNRRGKSVHLSVAVMPLPGSNGNPKGTIITIDDFPDGVPERSES